MLKSLPLILFLLLPLLSRSQNPEEITFRSINLNKLTNAEGLSQVSVNAIFKDSEDFLWIGTDDGLNRYDGIECKKFYNRFDDPSTIAANEVYGICEDNLGRIWLAHYNGGISIYDKKTETFARIGEGKGSLPTNRVYGIICDSHGTLIARTVLGLSFINPVTFQITNATDSSFEDLTNSTHIDILEHESYYWFGSHTKGLLRVDKDRRPAPFTAWKKESMGKAVMALYPLSGRSFLAGSEKGLFKIDGTGSVYTVTPLLVDPALFGSTLKILRYGNTPYVWVATDQKGLLIINMDTRKIIRQLQSDPIKDNLLSNTVVYLLQDAEKNIFIGTSRGVNIYSPYNSRINNYENIFRKIPNFGHPIYAIHELSNGEILLGTKKGGAYLFDPVSLQIHPIPIEGFRDKQNLPVIYHFTEWNNDTLLVCSGNGIFELSLRERPWQLRRSASYPELTTLNQLKITDICFENPRIAWIASFTEGLLKWELTKHQLTRIQKNSTTPEKGPVDNQIQKICPAQNKQMILCTKYGFSVLDPSNLHFENFTPGSSYPSTILGRNIKYAFDDGDNIWVTTFGAGLHKWNKKNRRFRAYTTREGLPNDAVYAVIPDNNGRLWISTNNGLAVMDTATGTIQTYITQDGLPDNEFNGFAGYKSKSGKLFFSTLNGMLSVDPTQEESNTFAPPIKLLEVIAHDGVLDSSLRTYGISSISLPAGFNSVDFKFAALSFAAPQKIQYKVMLKGYDEGWLHLQHQNHMRYANLKPGKYTLYVASTTNGQTWSEQMLILPVAIEPFWHQTYLFYFVSIIFVILLLGMLAKAYYTNYMQKQKDNYEKKLAIEMERQRISTEIHDDIGSSLSALRLLTALTESKTTDAEIRNEVHKLQNSLGDVQDKIREVIWSLNSENDNLESLIYFLQRQATQLFENSPIELKTEIPNNIPDIQLKGEFRRHIALAVKEALHNALKHSMAQICILKITTEGNTLSISVTDDGNGMDITQPKRGGNGITNMETRMKKVGGTLSINSGMNTLVTFIIPI